MPVNLENLLRQAATCIDPKKDKGAYAYMIGEEVALAPLGVGLEFVAEDPNAETLKEAE